MVYLTEWRPMILKKINLMVHLTEEDKSSGMSCRHQWGPMPNST